LSHGLGPMAAFTMDTITMMMKWQLGLTIRSAHDERLSKAVYRYYSGWFALCAIPTTID